MTERNLQHTVDEETSIKQPQRLNNKAKVFNLITVKIISLSRTGMRGGHIETLSQTSTTSNLDLPPAPVDMLLLCKVNGIEPSQDAVDLVSWHPNLMQEGTSILAYKDGHKTYNCSHSCHLRTGMMIFHETPERRTILKNSYKDQGHFVGLRVSRLVW